MRSCLFPVALFPSFFLCPCAVSLAAGPATVKVETARVYSRRDASLEVVRTFKKGDALVVGLALAGQDGEWCSVREPGQKSDLGYMRCDQLEREPRRPAVIAAPRAATPPEAQAPPPFARRSRPAPRDTSERHGERYMRPFHLWTGILGFTAEQEAQAQELAGRMGEGIFGDLRIPLSQMDPVALALLARYPAPTSPGFASITSAGDPRVVQLALKVHF